MRVTPKLVCYFSTGVNCTLPKTGQNCTKRIIKVNYSIMSYMFVLFLSSAISSSQGLCISVFFRSILPVLFLHHKNLNHFCFLQESVLFLKHKDFISVFFTGILFCVYSSPRLHLYECSVVLDSACQIRKHLILYDYKIM